jgi:6-phosphofructokinase 1
MIRIRRDDFEDPHELAKFAATCGLSLEEFRQQFEYLIADEPPPLDLLAGRADEAEATVDGAADGAAGDDG